MTSEQIIQRVDKIIVEHAGVDPSRVVPEALLEPESDGWGGLLKGERQPDLGLDSLDRVELVMAFEEEFNIEIFDEVAEKIRTVADCHKVVEQGGTL